MLTAILGKKLGMTQVFDENGRLVPVTVIQASPMTVTQKKSEKTDGYEAVQVGFESVKENRLNKPKLGHLKKNGIKPLKYIRELPAAAIDDLEVGQEIKAEDVLTEGDTVAVTGTSKGKGFAGAVKRWHFHGADMTHGSMIHRKPQSGGATDAARTFKGVKRPGRMGGETVTVRRLKVFRVDSERNLVLIKGAVPGATGGLVVIRKMKKGD
ncbi:MAG TPA: 50S ribosomal protein L3 [Armatimonadota bacterium]|nr:50S ribosomal protein L3 [Armatimonadota bacterium]